MSWWLAGTLVLIAGAGVASAGLYLRARQWVNAALVVVAAVALGVLMGGLQGPAGAAQTATLTDDDVRDDHRAQRVQDAAVVKLAGDGLSEAQWHDLPARPLVWQPGTEATLTLDFPRQIALGRSFDLTLRRSPAPAPSAGAWKLQLLDENNRLLAEAPGTGSDNSAEATVHWRPPVAQTLLLQARVLGAAGEVLAPGPVPLQVQDVAPLQVQGRLGAPSFDAQALNSLLVGSGAVVDWQVTLGKTLTRSETARSAMAAPDLIVIDAAQFEGANPAARSTLLAQVAAGAPLLVLATNASSAALWAQQLQLPLVAQASEAPRLLKLAGGLELPGSALVPSTAAAGPWTAADQRQPWLWQRPWQAGRIAWLGVSDWHRYAISNPQALGAWWQTVLDRLQVQRAVELAWDVPAAMPLAGERGVVCARGAHAEMAVRVAAQASHDEQTLHLQRRADTTDAACAALWPHRAGWHTLQAVDGRLPPGRFYVYAATDWPQWQRALRRQATALYAARTPTAPVPRSVPLPAWPAAALFTLAMLGLWWRERR